MRARLTVFLCAVVLALGLAGPQARALQSSDPSGLVSSLVSDALSTITNEQLSDAQRETNFRNLLEAGFDIPRISRFVLGRFWNAASDQDRQKFNALFEDWIVRTYASRFKSYNGQTIRVTGSRPESDTTTVVLSEFVNTNGAPPARVEWHVRKGTDGVYKIVDVSVEGVSMALTQRDEIAAVADRNGGTVQALNAALQNKIQSGEVAPATLPTTH